MHRSLTEALAHVKTVDGRKVFGTVSGVPSSGLGLSFSNGVSDNISYGEMEILNRITSRRTYRKRLAWIGAGASVRANGSPVLGVQMVSTHNSRGILSCPLHPVVSHAHCRLAYFGFLVSFLLLLLPGLVLAQVPELPSEEPGFKKTGTRGWDINLTLADSHWDDMIRAERFRLKSGEHGRFQDRLRPERPVTEVSAIKPVAHVSVTICDRTAAVIDVILGRISGASNCSEVTSTQLAAITSLNLRSRNISSLNEGDFDGLISLIWLDLRRNDLSTLPDGIFDQLTSLTSLYLEGNAISTLPNSIFDQLTSLTRLDLRKNDLVTLPDGIFDQLASLTSLDLYGNAFSTLPDGIFDQLTSLTGLGLGGNSFRALPKGIFDQLTSLTSLFLDGNAFSRLPDGIFDPLTSLRSLGLGNNGFSTLPDGIFDQLTSLRALYLSRNAFRTLPDGIFDQLTSLSVLYLSRNAFRTLPDGIFDQLTSLTDLGLGGNAFSTLPDGIFDQLISLTGLDLSGNVFGRLPDGIFDQLTSLIVLLLDHNGLSTLPDGIFDQLTSLTWLDLHGNAFNMLPDGIFDQLTSLTWLFLWDNDLVTLPDGIFDQLTSLTRLDLDGNAFSSLRDGIFDQLTSLTRLFLDGNAFNMLPDGIFDQLTSLTWLDLHGNALSTLPDGIFDQLTSLRLLALHGNAFSTLPDGIFDQLTSLRLLDLRDNDLVSLPDDIFKNLTQLPLDNSINSFFSGLSLQNNPGAPFRPVVNAGADLTVQPGATVSIPGSAMGPWSDFVRWKWIQVDGPDSDTPISRALPLTGGDTATPSFAAPMVEGDLHFMLVAVPGHEGAPTESRGHANSDPDWVTVRVATATNTTEPPSVVDFALLGNYPNPFNPSTTILLDVPQVAAVSVDVFNLLGQRVHRQDFPDVAAGPSIPLALDVPHLSSGTYVYQVTGRMGEKVHHAGGRMTLIK